MSNNNNNNNSNNEQPSTMLVELASADTATSTTTVGGALVTVTVRPVGGPVQRVQGGPRCVCVNSVTKQRCLFPMVIGGYCAKDYRKKINAAKKTDPKKAARMEHALKEYQAKQRKEAASKKKLEAERLEEQLLEQEKSVFFLEGEMDHLVAQFGEL
jgi:hypothetical protein